MTRDVEFRTRASSSLSIIRSSLLLVCQQVFVSMTLLVVYGSRSTRHAGNIRLSAGAVPENALNIREALRCFTHEGFGRRLFHIEGHLFAMSRIRTLTSLGQREAKDEIGIVFMAHSLALDMGSVR